ncbi:MAG: hypothetical protein AUH46_03385 [Gemmatimonadetes bacterium 13_1_40CM_70_15]|nr:MAG: hypothetical protein AUH46_03385 [Gemmatimonadetes bacterium 13_1_40CM_70_15]
MTVAAAVRSVRCSSESGATRIAFEDLDAAADRQDGAVPGACGADQLELERIAPVVGLLEPGMGGRAVAGGVHVLPPREHQPACGVHDRTRVGGVDERRDDEGQEPGAGERADVRGVEGDPLAPGVGAARGGDGDDRRHGFLSAAGVGPRRGQRGLLVPAQFTRTP